jgi:hypothetical protein
MKSDIAVSRNNIPAGDRSAWLFFVRMYENRKNSKAADFIEFAEKVCRQFPHLPDKMVWGNYLIPDIDEDFVEFHIDSPNPDEIKFFVRKLAREHGFVCWMDGEIDRPDRTVRVKS